MTSGGAKKSLVSNFKVIKKDDSRGDCVRSSACILFLALDKFLLDKMVDHKIVIFSHDNVAKLRWEVLFYCAIIRETYLYFIKDEVIIQDL